MELRDEFASIAFKEVLGIIPRMNSNEIANTCYKLADAMMEARKENQKEQVLSALGRTSIGVKCSCGRIIPTHDNHYKFIMYILDGFTVIRNDTINHAFELINLDTLKDRCLCVCSITKFGYMTLTCAETPAK